MTYPQLRTLMDNTDSRGKSFLVWTESTKLEHPGKIQIQDQLEFFPNRRNSTDCSVKLSTNNIFVLI